MIIQRAIPPAYEDVVESFQQLVVALTGPFGSGVSTTAQEIQQWASRTPGITVEIVKVSTLIAKRAQIDPSGMPPVEKRRKLQEAGNSLRSSDPSFVGKLILWEIFRRRELSPVASGALRIYVVDSCKNEADLAPLREVYGPRGVYLVSVHAPFDTRFNRVRTNVTDSKSNQSDFTDVDEIDRGEKAAHGQQVEKLAPKADYFIRNDNDTRTMLQKKVERLLRIILGARLVGPTASERAMVAAWAASLNSLCLSRQVGASIVTPLGEVLSVGHNDVPKAMGGVYASDDRDKERDYRCYNWGDQVCYNTRNQIKIIEGICGTVERRLAADAIQKKISSTSAEDAPLNTKQIAEVVSALRGVLFDSEITQILEFSRSVHAEVSAIVSLAREGRAVSKGSHMYVTTFPCHNCARHIVCAGVERLYFIEPYPKSRVSELHNDSVVVDPPSAQEVQGKVVFVHYEGVAPRRFNELFLPSTERKDKATGLVRNPDVGDLRSSAGTRIQFAPSEKDPIRLSGEELEYWIRNKQAFDAISGNAVEAG